MAIISLQYKVKIDQQAHNENDQKFLSIVNDFVSGLPSRIITAQKIESWQVFKEGYSQEYKEMSDYLSHRAKYDLKRSDYMYYDLSGRYPIQLDWHNIEVEVNYLEIRNLAAPEISVFFCSPQYLLLECFGNKLLVSENLNLAAQSKLTMVVEISEFLTIREYWN